MLISLYFCCFFTFSNNSKLTTVRKEMDHCTADLHAIKSIIFWNYCFRWSHIIRKFTSLYTKSLKFTLLWASNLQFSFQTLSSFRLFWINCVLTVPIFWSWLWRIFGCRARYSNESGTHLYKLDYARFLRTTILMFHLNLIYNL